MITIQTTNSYRTLFIGILVSAVIAASAYITLHTIRTANAADPAIIIVNTVVDEDSTPGLGCSLYEAVVAANTAAPYGGCTAGSAVDGTIIQVPAGVYVNDAVEGSPRRTIVLDNISLQGAGSDQTFLEAYFVELRGDLPAQLGGISISNVAGDQDRNPGLKLSVNGSNKTVSDVTVTSNDVGIAPNYVTLADDASTVENITLDRLTVSNGVQGYVSCGGTCSDVTITQFTGSAVGENSIQFENSEDVTIQGATIVNQSGGYIQVGENSRLEDISTRITDSGTSVIEVKAGTVVDGVEQATDSQFATLRIRGEAASVSNVEQNAALVSGGRASVELQVDTPSIDGYVVDGGSVYLRNVYAGSDIRNVSVESDQSTVVINATASNIQDITVRSSADSSVAMTNTYNNATVRGIDFTANDSSVYSPASINLTGDNGVYEDFLVESSLRNSRVQFNGNNPSLHKMKLVNAVPSLTLSGADVAPFSINEMTVDGGSDFALNVAGGDYTDGSITNSVFKGTDRGLYISAQNGDTVVVSNTEISNIGSLGAPGALYVNRVAEVTIDSVTIDRSKAGTPGVIYVNGGSNHTIKNTTISDSNGGLMMIATDSPLVADVNNVTILNNADPVGYDINADNTALMGYGGVGTETTYNVFNSIIGGTSNYVGCMAAEEVVFNIISSLASDPGCVDKGFTEIEDVSTIADAVLAVNNSTRSQIGYDQDTRVKTLRLGASSQALMFGDPSTCETTDARGVTRSILTGCDAGAYQLSVAFDDEEEQGAGGGSGSGQVPGGPSGAGAGNSGVKPANTVAVSNNDTVEDAVDDDVKDTDVTPISEADNGLVDEDGVNELTENTSNDEPPVGLIVAGVIGGLVLIGAIAGIALRKNASN